MKSIRSFLAVVSAALLTGVLAVVGLSAPADAAPTKGSLSIVSVTDSSDSTLGLLVQGREFTVVVQVLDENGQPTTLTKATKIVLEENGPGTLSGVTTATIPKDGSSVTFSGLTYSTFANDVTLTARVVSGVALTAGTKIVDFVYSAVTKNASADNATTVNDSNCGAPTAAVPNCGQLLLPHGANGRVTMYVGSCDGLGPCGSAGSTKALVVTAVADIKDLSTSDPNDTLYSKTSPATLILACDKALCRETANGVPKLDVIYTLNNEGALNLTADPCPSKGTLGPDQQVCVDYTQSKRQNGDLYSYLLFDYDLRASHP